MFGDGVEDTDHRAHRRRCQTETDGALVVFICKQGDVVYIIENGDLCSRFLEMSSVNDMCIA